jgi:protoporphyrinogen oxidase
LIRSLEHESQDKIIRNFDVNSISQENNRWIVSNGTERRSYDKLIATQPIFDVVRAIKDVPAEIYKALDDLKYNSLITVMLGLDVEHLNDFSWLYIPDGDCLAHRVAFPSNYSKGVAPEGKSAVLAEITYNNGDSIDRLSDDEIITRTIEELHKKKIIDKDTVCFTRAKRTRYAYVIPDLNYERNTELIKRFLSRRGIHLVGRFAEFKYLNMDACVRSAMDCAKVMNDE